MKQWLSCILTILCMLTGSFSVYADENNRIQIVSAVDQKPVEGAHFLFITETGETECISDTAGYVTSDGKGYWQEKEPAAGYYAQTDEKFQSGDKVQAQPVFLEFIGNRKGSYSLSRDGKNVESWQTDEDEKYQTKSTYIAGEELEFTFTEEDPYVYGTKQIITIPRTAPDQLPVYTLNMGIGGLLKLDRGSGTAEYQIYDEMKKKTDKIITNENGKGEMCLPAGKYTMKQISVDPAYDPDETEYSFEIRKKKDTGMICTENKAMAEVHLLANGTEVNGNITVMDDQNNEIYTGAAGSSFPIKRDGKYVVTVTELPAGYHIPGKREFTPAVRNWQISCIPFTVQFRLLDQFGNPVAGIPFSVQVNGKEMETIETEKDPVMLSSLYGAEDTLKIAPVQGADGYLLTGTEFTVPSDIEENYVISLNCRKYLHYRIHLQDEENNLDNKGIQIFTDETCTIPARDIQGVPVAGVTDAEGNYSFSADPGSYYVQEQEKSAGHLAMPVTELSADNTIMVPQTVLQVQIPAEGVKCSLLENGQVIQEWTSDAKSKQIAGLLEEGKEYELNCDSETNVFLADQKKKFIFSDQLALEMIAIPFVPCTAKKENSTFGIYLDEQCEHMAADIYGNPALSVSGQNVDMAFGKYWLKELNCSPNFQLDEKAYALYLNQGDTDVIIALQAEPAGMLIQTVDAAGQPAEGVGLTIYDDNGSQITSFQSDGTDMLITKELERGKRYYVSPDKGKTGVSLEVPDKEYGTAVVRKTNAFHWQYGLILIPVVLYLWSIRKKKKA